MKNLIKIFICTSAYVIFGYVTAQAQFMGGQGDGAQKSSSIQNTLNGDQINTLALFQGGHNDGHDKNSVLVTLAGAELAELYGGGKDDGSSKYAFQGTLAGADLTLLYLGGNGDGHDKRSYQGALNGTLIEGLYIGGIGDGNNKISFSGVLNGQDLSQLYSGGIGDGFNKLNNTTLLDGALLEQLYLGGICDGHDKNQFAGVLDGSMLSSLYSGGFGDGFSKQQIQYIFDFPECTYVVNTDDLGFGSLRYAINCAAPGDTIDFSPLLIQDSIVLIADKIDITKDLFVNGIKSAELTIDASLMERAIKTGSNIITIKGLKIIVGTDPAGGAVLNNGTLTLMDVDIYDPTNNATSVIHNTISGSLRIKGDVTIQEN